MMGRYTLHPVSTGTRETCGRSARENRVDTSIDAEWVHDNWLCDDNLSGVYAITPYVLKRGTGDAAKESDKNLGLFKIGYTARNIDYRMREYNLYYPYLPNIQYVCFILFNKRFLNKRGTLDAAKRHFKDEVEASMIELNEGDLETDNASVITRCVENLVHQRLAEFRMQMGGKQTEWFLCPAGMVVKAFNSVVLELSKAFMHYDCEWIEHVRSPNWPTAEMGIIRYNFSKRLSLNYVQRNGSEDVSLGTYVETKTVPNVFHERFMGDMQMDGFAVRVNPSVDLAVPLELMETRGAIYVISPYTNADDTDLNKRFLFKIGIVHEETLRERLLKYSTYYPFSFSVIDVLVPTSVRSGRLFNDKRELYKLFKTIRGYVLYALYRCKDEGAKCAYFCPETRPFEEGFRSFRAFVKWMDADEGPKKYTRVYNYMEKLLRHVMVSKGCINVRGRHLRSEWFFGNITQIQRSIQFFCNFFSPVLAFTALHEFRARDRNPRGGVRSAQFGFTPRLIRQIKRNLQRENLADAATDGESDEYENLDISGSDGVHLFLGETIEIVPHVPSRNEKRWNVDLQFMLGLPLRGTLDAFVKKYFMDYSKWANKFPNTVDFSI